MPSDEQKEGDANDYIRGSDPVLYFNSNPDRIVLCNLQRIEKAATTRNSDGGLNIWDQITHY